MKKILNFILSLFCMLSASGQNMVLHDPVSSRSFNSDRYAEVKGSPFIIDKWIEGNARSARGIYKNVQLKLDAYNNILYFNKNDEAFEFQEQILSFELFNADTLRFKKGLSGNSLKPEQYLQVLSDGKVSLYRSDIKIISEMSEINAGMIKTFNSSTRYYLSKDGQIHLIKLNKNDVLSYLDNKTDLVKTFIEEQKIGSKKEADFIKILNYYNSLN